MDNPEKQSNLYPLCSVITNGKLRLLAVRLRGADRSGLMRDSNRTPLLRVCNGHDAHGNRSY